MNGPVVNRDAINALFPPGSLGRNTGVVYLDSPDRSVPRTSQLTMGYERQLGATMAATVDYVHSWNQNQLITYNLNPGTRVNTSRTGRHHLHRSRGHRGQLGISPFGNAVYERVNDGSSQFDGVNFSLEKRLQRRLGGARVVRDWPRARQRGGEPDLHQPAAGGRGSECWI